MLRPILLFSALVVMYALLARNGASQAAVALTIGGAFVAGLILTLVKDS
jgi:hypothetical protein